MPGSTYDAVRQHKQQLVRKMIRGSVFIAPTTADPITTITDATDKLLAALPTGYEDLGILSADGGQYSRDVNTSDLDGWGYSQPVRSDVTSDTGQLQVACEETKKLTMGLYLGADMSSVTPATNGEISVQKPALPSSKYYRVLLLGVDTVDGAELYLARFMPNAKVVSFEDQNFQGSDDTALTWSVTFQAYEDSALGYSEDFLAGGPGWFNLLTDMGWTAPTGG